MLNENLANTMRAWDRFHRDRSYFRGLKEEDAVRSLASLVKMLQELDDLKRTLGSLEKTCEKAYQIVSNDSSYIDSREGC